MKNSDRSYDLKSVDDLFSTEEARQDEKREKVVDLPLVALRPFKDHPFKVTDDERMIEMADSVREHGVLVPVIVRPCADGVYEIVSGHRRHRASELAGTETLPCIVREMDDDTATIIMVDSNLQRENVLPSERAKAYKMKLDAMRRRAGRPSKENVSQLGTQKRSDQLMAEQMGESRNQIQRFIRLTNLVPSLLDMVDERKIAMNPAVELSYLPPDQQVKLLDAMDMEQATPSLSQAQRLKRFSQEGKLDQTVMQAILSEEKKPPQETITLTAAETNKLFPRSFTVEQKKAVILRLLSSWYQRRQREQER